MSLTTIPPTGLSLNGFVNADDAPKQFSAPAILFKLSDDLLNDVRKASSVQGGLQLLTGNIPKIRLGKRTIDLTISPESFHHELYSASTGSLTSLEFAGLVSHRAEINAPERKQSLGSDAALAALQSSLASYQQEKQAKSVNISNNVVAEPKNRWEAAREQKQARRRGLVGQHTASPSIGATSAPRATAAPTLDPISDSATRMQAMRTPLIHLLAMKPHSREDMLERTRIPKEDLDEILTRIGKQEQGKWQLTDRAYKELDVWKFGYSSKEDRQAAVDNAIRAYDRLRLGKDEKIWQQLLPEEDRDKGTVLSKLHLGPRTNGSPLLQEGGAGDSNLVSATSTPRLGPSASTPRSGGGKNDGAGLTKRLFAKDPKKQRAAEEAKEKKRKDREAAASDREGGKPPVRKKQTTKTNNPKVKSAEIVRSSSEESEGEIRVQNKVKGGTSATGSSKQPKPVLANEQRKPVSNTATKPKARPLESTSPNGNDTLAKLARPKTMGGATPKPGTPSTRPTSAATTKTSKPAALGGKSTPNGLSAPSSQHRRQLSPQKADSRPTVPSPLGAARPRVASDVSDRGAVGVQRVRQGAETPKGLGITNGVRKRQGTVASTDSYPSTHAARINGDHPEFAAAKVVKPSANGISTPKPLISNGTSHKESNGMKRKTLDSPSFGHNNGPAPKHRKTESTSTSSHSQKSSLDTNSSTDARRERGTSSDSVSSIINDITFSQGLNMAQKFRDVYYPRYAEQYDKQAAMEKRGETVSREDRVKLWEMHRRLEQMKREIQSASERAHLDE